MQLRTDKKGNTEFMKKKIVSTAAFILTFIMIIMATGCGNKVESTSKNTDAKLKIVTSIFPEYDWVKEILGDRINEVNLVLLQKEGTDMHSFQPSVQDMAEISDCDLFIYTGGVSDEWAKSAIENATNKDMKVIDIMQVLGDDVKEEELKEGMQDDHESDHEAENHSHEDEDDHDHDDGDDHEHDDENSSTHENDEHVWLSLNNAAKVCKSIEAELAKLEPDSKSAYVKNTQAYIDKLNSLDEKYKTMVAGSKNDTLIFGDRFPFLYLLDDYDIDYYAAFAGCSAETEASFETIVFLSDKIDELESKDIMVLENSDGKVAKSIKDNTASKDQNIVELNSMQSVKSSDIDNGVTYISIMEGNYEILKQVLNR